jgi:hypothetical protein
MRMRGLQTNERDQRLVQAAASDAAANLLDLVLPALVVSRSEKFLQPITKFNE